MLPNRAVEESHADQRGFAAWRRASVSSRSWRACSCSPELGQTDREVVGRAQGIGVVLAQYGSRTL